MARSAHLLQAATRTDRPVPVRFVTATTLYDGHDASINLVRRLLLDAGAEVIHLGHNRSATEVVRTAIQEDADAIAVSSYQGGHMEYFRYLVDLLDEQRASGIQVFTGGGGTITRDEANALQQYGITRVYTAEDGQQLGLQGLVRDVINRTRLAAQTRVAAPHPDLQNQRAIAQTLSCIEQDLAETRPLLNQLAVKNLSGSCPVVGITGTGGAGKSSLLDELLARLFAHFPELHIACLTVDPTRHMTGGAMLGDRIRINCAAHPNLYLRSMATRRRHLATSATLGQCIRYLQSLGFGLVLIETAGTGQGDSEICELADISIYVMTSDYGAPGQLEKIEMLNYADLVALNKADQQGAMDALEEVRRQWRLDRSVTDLADEQLPVYATSTRRFADSGIERLFATLCRQLSELHGQPQGHWEIKTVKPRPAATTTNIIPSLRRQYLAEIAAQGRRINEDISALQAAASAAQHYYCSLQALGDPQLPDMLRPYTDVHPGDDAGSGLLRLRQCYMDALGELEAEATELLISWPSLCKQYRQPQYRYTVRGQHYTGETTTETLSHTQLRKIALPHFADWGETLRFLMKENLPGHYPYTAGVFPYRRTTEDPARMFAGEGIAENTNRRFHLLSRGQRAIRLSTAFDPVTLYGEDPDERPDIYGRIGMSGVSVATLDDFKRLYSGFDLSEANTSVSMTINGPGPVALACFMNTAIDQQVEIWLHNSGQWSAAERQIQALYRDRPRPMYRGELPAGHDGLGLGLLGVSGTDLLDVETYSRIRSDTLAQLRGTLQADILKEEQAQNECLFPIEFALRMMGDVQEYITRNQVRNYYTISVSGYHIAEAGANPITQLAFTLANGFTLVEYFLARGMNINDFAPHLSFFFSNALDAEYAVIGRVARRIWARAMRERYHANERSQQLKYHIQTSGRSLQMQDYPLNDIRTTLQAAYAIADNCNSLHTNAADEAVTTPTEETVRRALAIQMIIIREFGLGRNENTLQGSFIIDELTDLVEAAVYREFDRLSARGGVLAAMDARYQRRVIQEESFFYEQQKSTGNLPVVGVNTFVADERELRLAKDIPVVRSSDAEKQAQIRDVASFRQHHAREAPTALASLQQVAGSSGNIFSELLDTVRVATLGQITHSLYACSGRYRRSL